MFAALVGPGKSALFRLHGSPPGFAAICPKTLDQSKLEKNQRKVKENFGGAQWYHDAIENVF